MSDRGPEARGVEPVGAPVGSRRSELSPAKQRLLDRMLRGEAPDVQARTGTPPAVRRRASAPLSFSQERVWFLGQLAPGNPVYNIPVGVRLRGDLRLGALGRSLERIVRRHETLRTSIGMEDGRPVQQVAPPGPPSWGVCDLTRLPVQRLRAEAERLATAEARRPFDPARGPLFRSRILRLGPRDHAALLTMHHLVSDGWSVGVLIRELTEHYHAFAAGVEHPETPLPVQYRDYAERQREWAEGPGFRRELEYWRGKLEGAPPVIELPGDRPRPPVRSHRGCTVRARLPRVLVERLSALARDERTTPFMALVALVDALLLHLTGESDVVVGTPVAGRTRREYEDLIGFFANTLALRCDLSGAPGFRTLLSRVRTTALEAYEHQRLPFEKLVEELQPERSTSHSPLFQVMAILDNSIADELALSGVELSAVESDYGAAKFDLTFTFAVADDGLSMALEHSTDLFDRTTARRFLDWLRALAEAVVAAPDTPVDRHGLLSHRERHHLLREWNDTARAHPGATLHALVRERSAVLPDAVAVDFEGEQVSYGELLRRAADLAQALAAQGVGPDVPVAVALERSVALVVALLGVLEAGAAYLPLDTSYPEPRLETMVADAAPPVVLVPAGAPPGFDLGPARPVALRPDGRLDDLGSPRAEPLAVPSADALAYVIYTSGSTGRPKGVMNSHRSIVNRLRWMQERYRLGPGDRVLQKTPFSFDVSVWEFFWTLMEGARLVVARPRGHLDAAYLVRRIRSAGITTVHFVPSMLEVFLEEREVDTCTSVRRVIASGEALEPRHVDGVLTRLEAELHNLYGPTEAAVDVTAEPCPAVPGGPRVAIGRPIANTAIHLVDAKLRPAPPGVAGELSIAGVNLARGYLGRAALSAERFVPSPWGPPGGRVYRTGDLARHRADGRIEYLGRIDSQVKLRGFRIELGEVESALSALPGVSSAAAAVTGAGSEGVLVGYYVSAQGAGPTADRLRRALAAVLPEHLVPGVLVELDELPTTPSGKIDRKALPGPDARRRGEIRAYVPPRGGVERTVAEVWREVLGVERIGREDNFFEIGGHSLRLVRVRSRLVELLSRDMPVLDLFRYPTIRSLAGYLEGEGEEPSAVEEVERRRDRQQEGKRRLHQRLRRRGA